MLNIWCLEQVLRWYGYFKEAVTESAVENYRVRKVVIFFYLEDNSCQVVEPKEDNSGLPQVTPPLRPPPCHHRPLTGCVQKSRVSSCASPLLLMHPSPRLSSGMVPVSEPCKAHVTAGKPYRLGYHISVGLYLFPSLWSVD